MSFLAAARSIGASALGGGAAGGGPVGQSVRNVITVVPSDVNVGEILSQAFNQGSFHNGGYGLQVPSRYMVKASNVPNLAATAQNEGGSIMPWVMVGVAGLVGLVLLTR